MDEKTKKKVGVQAKSKKTPVAQAPAEKSLQENEARFRAIFENSRDAIGVSKAGIHVMVNPAYLELFGYPAGTDLAGKPVLDLIAPSAHDQISNYVSRRVNGDDAPSVYETRGLRTDGTEFDMEVSASVFHESGEGHTLVFLRDITERKQAAEETAERRVMLQQILDTASVAIFLVDTSGRIMHANQRMAEMFGYSMEELVGSEYVGLVHPSERETGRQKMLALMASQIQPVDLERLYWRKDGSEFWGHLAGRRFHDAQGNELGLIGVIADINEHKLSELKLRQSEERFKAITMTASDAILLMDDRGKIVYWNPAAEHMFGYSAGEAFGKNLHIFLAPQRLHKDYLKGFENFVKTGQGPVINRSMEMVAIKKDGAEFPIEVSTSAMNIDGRWHALGIIRDITERKQSEEKLRENQARLDLALQSAHMGVWHWEIREDRRYFDDLTCLLLGIDAATFTGTEEEFFQAVHPEDRDNIKAALSMTIEQDQLYELSYRVVWPDSSVRYITARGRLVRDDKGQPLRIHGILWDITRQRLLEQELIKAQKLESVGTLAGGIAHDFNNLLQGVFGYISMARLTYDQREKSLAMLEQAEEALHLSVNLTSQLLTFSKGGMPIKRLIDLRPAIENAVKFALSGSHTDYRMDIASDLWPVEADAGQLAQVIQNIVLNANDAMAGKGTVHVSVKNMDVPPQANLRLSDGGQFVRIDIQDTGTGIPEQNLPKIFDPYFTTKQRGSGLGLATSYSIIKNHGGLIEVRSEPNRGTTFTIYLPASMSAEVKTVIPAVSAAVGTKKLRILLMDDEDLVRNVAKALITALGHEVEGAKEGRSAIEMFNAARETGRPFDLLILDLTIKGGMGGEETIAKIRYIDPNVKAVVSSGYADSPIVANYREYGFSGVLNKPYRLDALKNCLDLFIL